MKKFGTKAETLQMIYRRLKYSEVLPLFSFMVREWKVDQEKIRNVFMLFGLE